MEKKKFTLYLVIGQICFICVAIKYYNNNHLTFTHGTLNDIKIRKGNRVGREVEWSIMTSPK